MLALAAAPLHPHMKLSSSSSSSSASATVAPSAHNHAPWHEHESFRARTDDGESHGQNANAKESTAYHKYVLALQQCEARHERRERQRSVRFRRATDGEDETQSLQMDKTNLKYTLYRFEQIIVALNNRERRPFYKSHDVNDFHSELQFVREAIAERNFSHSLFAMDDAVARLKTIEEQLAADWNLELGAEYNNIADLLTQVLIEVENLLSQASARGRNGGAPHVQEATSSSSSSTMERASLRHILHRLQEMETQLSTENRVAKLDDATLRALYTDISHIHRSLRYMRLDHLELVQRIERQLRLAKMGVLHPNEILAIGREVRAFRFQLDALRTSEVVEDDERHLKIAEHANRNLVELLKEENVLDLSLKQVYQNFVLTWHKIFMELADPLTYQSSSSRHDQEGGDAHEDEWWQVMYRILRRLMRVFTERERPIYVGIGLLLASFFSYYLTLAR